MGKRVAYRAIGLRLLAVIKKRRKENEHYSEIY